MQTDVRTGGADDIVPAADLWAKAYKKYQGTICYRATQEGAVSNLSARATRRDAEFLIAEFHAAPVGMLFAAQAREDDGAGALIPRLLHVSYVAVDPAHWGRGIATRLLDQVVSLAQSKGYKSVQLWVDKENARARNLYEHYGFISSGREKSVDPAHPSIHYELDLRRTRSRLVP